MTQPIIPDQTLAARPAVLCILDGWGLAPPGPANAIHLARTPVMDRLMAACPFAPLQASESHVGLPGGQMGNSEVGHMTIGAGRVVLQDLPRIDHELASGALLRRPAFTRFAARLRETGGAAHLAGLLSPGGVHAHQAHLAALARALDDAGIPVRVHAFLDGRDTPPRSAAACLESFAREAPRARIATLAGRYYAMDRDNNWDRVEPACRAIAAGGGPRAASAAAALAASYDAGRSDEFLSPCVIDGYGGAGPADGLLAVNFRADRIRQLMTALLDPAFAAFARPARSFGLALGMVSYSDALDRLMDVLLPAALPEQGLGQVASENGLRQLRIAETEKYAHVTFFLNGGREAPFTGEERILVPSPKVASYDLKPEMSAPELTAHLARAVESRRFGLIVANYANADMVGHSGLLEPAIAAAETLDRCIGALLPVLERSGTPMLIIADHGNAEMMREPGAAQPHTAHTLNPVPAILAGPVPGVVALAPGGLADVAPTLLELMNLPAPPVMTGRSLLRHAARPRAD